MEESLSFSLHPRLVKKEKTDGPGPGAYDPSHSAVFDKTPSWGLGGYQETHKKTRQEASPGPGAYYNMRTMSEGPKWSLRGRSRGRKIRDELPGPGQYKLTPMVGNLPYYLSPKT